MRVLSVKTTERLRGVDALRGIAALGVVLYHAVGYRPHGQTGALWSWLAGPLWVGASFGYAGVFLFFVISGFCIHLQWARRRKTEDKPSIDFRSFWKRRFRRLYPPYLIALAIYLLVAGFTTKLQASAFYVWDITSHIFMLHNLDSRTVYSINGVFWTLAVEEQLYLAYFPLLFLRNRFGWRPTLIICLATRVIWLLFSVGARNAWGFDIPVTEAAASHWFTWALGALAVEAALGIVILPKWCSRTSLGVMALLSAVGLTYLLPVIESHEPLHSAGWLVLHPLWGSAFFFILNRLVIAEQRWRELIKTPMLVRTCASIGVFSYSLYLTHQLLLMESYRFTRLGLSETFVAVVILTPATIFFAWIFFAFCERPFLRPLSKATPPDNLLVPVGESYYFKVPLGKPSSLLNVNQVEPRQSG
ncbi:MAG: acyltransferase [Pyrinomonadaceae bacterium]